MNEATKLKTCKSELRRRNLHVEIQPRCYPYNFTSWTHERQEKWLMEWADDFRAFLRDHRSRDEASFSVECETYSACSHCGTDWETMVEDGKTMCAGCGAEVQP